MLQLLWIIKKLHTFYKSHLEDVLEGGKVLKSGEKLMVYKFCCFFKRVNLTYKILCVSQVENPSNTSNNLQ